MRLRHPDGQTVHLATVISVENVRDMPTLLRRLDTEAVPERERHLADVLSISLRLGPVFAATLASSLGMRRRLRDELAARALEVVTLDTGADATPPDGAWRAWCTYTLDLARVLVDLLPDDGAHGSVSTTLPFFGSDDEQEGQWQVAVRLLDDLSAGLTEIAWHTGRLVRVAIEPAPLTLISNSDGAVRLLSRADPARVGVCLNPHHLAMVGETPAQALAQLRRSRLAVVKVRLGATTQVAQQEAVTQAVLGSLLGGARADCDHLEASAPAQLDAALDELGVLGLDGATGRPMPGAGRA